MKKIMFSIFVLIVASLISIPEAQGESVPQMRAGKWEVAMSVDIPGLPFKMKPIITSQCYTEEDVANTEKSLPKPGKDAQCKVSNLKQSKGSVSYDFDCGKSGKGSGEVDYDDDSYDGVVKMEMGDSVTTMKYKGKRLGDCAK